MLLVGSLGRGCCERRKEVEERQGNRDRDRDKVTNKVKNKIYTQSETNTQFYNTKRWSRWQIKALQVCQAVQADPL